MTRNRQTQEDSAASGRATAGWTPAAEQKPAKPLSWFAMRRLERTLASRGPDKPDLADARRKALLEAAESGDPRVISLALKALEDDWIMVREAAAEALGILQAKDAVEPLVGLVTANSGGDLRRVAGMALGKIGDPRAVAPLLKLGLEQPQQRVWIVDAIARMGKPAVPMLIGCLKLTDPGLRLDAAVALGRIKAAEAVGPLVQAAADPHEVVRAHVADALGQIADPRGVPALVRLLGDSSPAVRVNAAAAVCRTPDPRAFEPLLRLLGDDAAEVRGYAVAALGRLGDPRAAEAASHLLEDESDTVRERAIETLGELADPRTESWLLPRLKDSMSHVRLRAVQVLARIGSEAAVRPLSALLTDFHEQVRKHAAEALGKIGSAHAVVPLSDLLQTERSLEVQLAAVRALGQLRDARALPALKEALVGEFALRSRVCAALGEIGDPQAIDTLAPLLQDPAPEIRYHAAVSLGNLGDKRALKPLETAMGEQDPFALRGVARALQSLGDPRGDRLLEQANRLAQATAKRAAAAATVAAAAQPAAPAKPERSKPRANPLATLGVMLGSLVEGLQGSLARMDAQRRLIVLGGVVLVPALCVGAWWFLRPSGNSLSMTEALQRGNIQSVAFAGSSVAVVTSARQFEFWDQESGSRNSGSEVAGIRAVHGSPDGQWLAVLFDEPKLELRDASGSVVATIDNLPGVSAIQFHSTSKSLAAIGADGNVVLCRVPDGGGRKQVKLDVEQGVTAVAVSPDHQHAAFGLSDGRIQLFKLETRENFATIRKDHHKTAIAAITFALQTATFATAGADGTTFVWDLAKAQKLLTLPGLSATPVTIMALSPDGKLLARGFSGGAVSVCQLDRLMAAASPKERSAAEVQMDILELNWEQLDTLAVSPDGTKVAMGCRDDLEVAVCDVLTGQLLKKLSPLGP